MFEKYGQMISHRHYGSDLSRLSETSIRFLDPGPNPSFLRISHFAPEEATVLDERVEEGYLYRTIGRRLVLKYVLWEPSEADLYTALPNSWIEDILGPGLSLSITLRRPIAPEGVVQGFQIYRIEAMTDMFRIPTNTRLRRLFNGNFDMTQGVLAMDDISVLDRQGTGQS
jgi:hypothetical protein